ncbi:MAG: Lin0512 family protein [Rhodospirillaceae bacterium]|nr:Lin0512 family protein [Rhodospirillaceae bacterium]
MKQVMFVELGMGVDLQGQDTTKAAVRAVKDAIGRNYLPGIRRLVEEGARMVADVRLAVPPQADTPDMAAVKAALPHGEINVEVVPGGMLTPNGLGTGDICVVNAAVTVAVER